MYKNYKRLNENVNSRLNPENILLEHSLLDELNSIKYSDVLVYVRNAMRSVGQAYTDKSLEAGDRVKDHLNSQIDNVSYRYQGSVMTNTHIKGYSDIDLVVISEKFYGWDKNAVTRILESTETRNSFRSSAIMKLEDENSATPYNGNSLDDLLTIRADCESTLSKIYFDCDISKAKAIQITNLHLKRDVDIVIANWYDDVNSIVNDKGRNRGIQIYNKESHSKETADYPFLSIFRINNRDSDTNGRLKKMIRFLKQCKADSEYEIMLSSFDINAICYNIDKAIYQNLSFERLVSVLNLELSHITNDPIYANQITSVDEREYIFQDNPDKNNHLELLRVEVEKVNHDLFT